MNETFKKANESHAFAVWDKLEELKETDKGAYDDFIDGIRLYMCSKQDFESDELFITKLSVIDGIYQEITGEVI